MTEALAKSMVLVNGRKMSYHERGSGRPILLLHGNPTSSYLWRNVLPPLEGLGRLIVPDLIGMGHSEKLPNPGPDTYRFQTHRQYLEGLINQLTSKNEDLILVVHDWGSALGFDWAHHHQDRVLGIAYMEAIVRPFAGWHEYSEAATPIFQGFRSDKGENLILDRNLFIERVLPGSVLRQLSDAEMTEYRRPFLEREDRWPTLTWPRSMPIGGEPSDVVAIISQYAKWLQGSTFPKLFVNADPGAILTGAVREFCRTFKNQTEVTVRGSHFIQEDSGTEIGEAVARWISDNKI
jgi:haloalkane dehalogenase